MQAQLRLRGAQARARPYVGDMSNLLAVLLGLVMLAILGVLGAGMFGLVRPHADPRRSNALMRARVLLQGVALVLVALILLTRHR
jgi:hypothetical protein